LNYDRADDRELEDLRIRFLLKRAERSRDAWRDEEDLSPGRAAILDLKDTKEKMLDAQERLTLLHPEVKTTVRNTFQFYETDGIHARLNENLHEERNHA
jgi:hypothetical protein